MSARKAPRARDATASKASGKAKTAPAKQKVATGQSGAKMAAAADDSVFMGLLQQEVAAARAASRALPDFDREADDAQVMLAYETPEEARERSKRIKNPPPAPAAVGQPATNTTSARLAEDIEELTALAIRLRTAAEARFHSPPLPGHEDPLEFAETVTPLIPQLVRATHLLVEFLNVDCDAGGLATQEITAVRDLMQSWPDLYFRHAGAQAIQTDKYKPEKLQIGSKLPWYIHRGKGDPAQSPNVVAAVNTLRFVYANLVRFALQPPGTENDENPLVTWVRTNKLKELCQFVLTMRYAPDKDRRKAMKDMEIECPGWELPAGLGPIEEDEQRREFAGCSWSDQVRHKIIELIEKYQERLQEDGAVVERRIDFTEWAPELKLILKG